MTQHASGVQPHQPQSPSRPGQVRPLRPGSPAPESEQTRPGKAAETRLTSPRVRADPARAQLSRHEPTTRLLVSRTRGWSRINRSASYRRLHRALGAEGGAMHRWAGLMLWLLPLAWVPAVTADLYASEVKLVTQIGPRLQLSHAGGWLADGSGQHFNTLSQSPGEVTSGVRRGCQSSLVPLLPSGLRDRAAAEVTPGDEAPNRCLRDRGAAEVTPGDEAPNRCLRDRAAAEATPGDEAPNRFLRKRFGAPGDEAPNRCLRDRAAAEVTPGDEAPNRCLRDRAAAEVTPGDEAPNRCLRDRAAAEVTPGDEAPNRFLRKRFGAPGDEAPNRFLRKRFGASSPGVTSAAGLLFHR
ncbi:unnamed protein product [Boreogadus saida]